MQKCVLSTLPRGSKGSEQKKSYVAYLINLCLNFVSTNQVHLHLSGTCACHRCARPRALATKFQGKSISVRLKQQPLLIIFAKTKYHFDKYFALKNV